MTEIHRFLVNARAFRSKLQACHNFLEIQKLWRETDLPYSVSEDDPFSESYRLEQLELYRALSGLEYTLTNELTSTRQSQADFERGYPWITGDLATISEHSGKVAQAFAALGSFFDRESGSLSVAEFGAGWGNLAIPLARSGLKVTCVDIDTGFLDRIGRIAVRNDLQIAFCASDFLAAAENLEGPFDGIIFQSSFHHCLDFDRLLWKIHEHQLSSRGAIFFLAEPIDEGFNLPWGLRHDGESLWAIMLNGWLELGFSRDFFLNLLFRNGYFVRDIPALGNLAGPGFLATKSTTETALRNFLLPKIFSDTWHVEPKDGHASFSKRLSVLPGLRDCKSTQKSYRLRIANYGVEDTQIAIKGELGREQVEIRRGEELKLQVAANCDRVEFYSSTYVPNEIYSNGDTREVGFAILEVAAG